MLTPAQVFARKTSLSQETSQNESLYCAVCWKPLEYSGTGRKPLYCSRKHKRQAERKRTRFVPFRPRQDAVSSPVSPPPEPELTRADAEAFLGRPLYSGDWEGYLEGTGRGQGGMPP